MKKFVLIVAGGSGSRMQNSVPKQFLEINGKPILMHTFEAFLKFDSQMEFILVLPENQTEMWDELCRKNNFQQKYQLAFGGETRFHSVKNGLELIDDEGIVFIHDGVRPLVAVESIKNCFSTALEKGNALPVIEVAESVREITGANSKAVDRSNYRLVQTPQTFKTGLIKKAYQQEFSNAFTDDASVLESAGEIINLVKGNRENIKITYPEDLLTAQIFLSRT